MTEIYGWTSQDPYPVAIGDIDGDGKILIINRDFNLYLFIIKFLILIILELLIFIIKFIKIISF